MTIEIQEGSGVIQNIKDFIKGRPTEMYPPPVSYTHLRAHET
jgi:hypothetical protein